MTTPAKITFSLAVFKQEDGHERFSVDISKLTITELQEVARVANSFRNVLQDCFDQAVADSPPYYYIRYVRKPASDESRDKKRRREKAPHVLYLGHDGTEYRYTRHLSLAVVHPLEQAAALLKTTVPRSCGHEGAFSLIGYYAGALNEIDRANFTLQPEEEDDDVYFPRYEGDMRPPEPAEEDDDAESDSSEDSDADSDIDDDEDR